MTEIEKPWLSSLATLAFYTNAALDKGLGAQVAFEEIYSGIDRGTLLQELDSKFPDTGFGVFSAGSDKEKQILSVLEQIAGGLSGRERRKVGVENSGLCLLLAFLIEAMQQGDWSDPTGRVWG